MSKRQPGNYLGVHRRRAGLTQRELGKLIGYDGKGPVPRHEQSRDVPGFLTALAYESVFQVPASAMFVGFRSSVAANVEGNLRKLHDELERLSEDERLTGHTRQKLQWLRNRLGLQT